MCPLLLSTPTARPTSRLLSCGAAAIARNACIGRGCGRNGTISVRSAPDLPARHAAHQPAPRLWPGTARRRGPSARGVSSASGWPSGAQHPRPHHREHRQRHQFGDQPRRGLDLRADDDLLPRLLQHRHKRLVHPARALHGARPAHRRLEHQQPRPLRLLIEEAKPRPQPRSGSSRGNPGACASRPLPLQRAHPAPQGKTGVGSGNQAGRAHQARPAAPPDEASVLARRGSDAYLASDQGSAAELPGSAWPQE